LIPEIKPYSAKSKLPQLLKKEKKPRQSITQPGIKVALQALRMDRSEVKKIAKNALIEAIPKNTQRRILE
jgi:hypothetical protein